jgi:AcrR family transcriptional regulator
MPTVNRSSGGNRKTRGARPRRGTPIQTRERLLTAAGSLFNRAGYHGTDSNQIAKEAGYATGTFYKHFRDKREVFLAVYEAWLSAEWEAIDAELSAGRGPDETARRLVELAIDFHTKWRGLRAALIELVFTDGEVRRFYRAQRRRQLDLIVQIRQRLGMAPGRREDDAIHLFTTERTYDAIGQGEIQALGLDREVVIDSMVANVLAMISGQSQRRA